MEFYLRVEVCRNRLTVVMFREVFETITHIAVVVAEVFHVDLRSSLQRYTTPLGEVVNLLQEIGGWITPRHT